MGLNQSTGLSTQRGMLLLGMIETEQVLPCCEGGSWDSLSMHLNQQKEVWEQPLPRASCGLLTWTFAFFSSRIDRHEKTTT